MSLIDEGVPKGAAEFLVHSRPSRSPSEAMPLPSACSRGQPRQRRCTFFVTTGNGSAHTHRPGAVRVDPIAWERAYGGAGHAENCWGWSCRSATGTLCRTWSCPSIAVQRPGLAAVPASYGSLDVMHPQRQALRVPTTSRG